MNVDINKNFLNSFMIGNKERKQRRWKFQGAKSSTVILNNQYIIPKME
jgi:hypothetical protein